MFFIDYNVATCHKMKMLSYIYIYYISNTT